MILDLCKSCEAKIFWAETVSGKSHPVDFEPTPGGNVEVRPAEDPREPPLVFMNQKLFGAGVRYNSHFATCPDSAAWSTS